MGSFFGWVRLLSSFWILLWLPSWSDGFLSIPQRHHHHCRDHPTRVVSFDMPQIITTTLQTTTATTTRQSRRSVVSTSTSTSTSSLYLAGEQEYGSNGEVVGGTGRIGSLLLQLGEGLLAHVPRGVAPGGQSPPDTPLYVSVSASASALLDVWESVPVHRRSDVVLVGNGLPPPALMVQHDVNDHTSGSSSSVTLVIPHFSVLAVGDWPNVHPQTPPTVVFGKHASTVAHLLSRAGIPVQIVTSLDQWYVSAVRKLIWASAMWLLCHDVAVVSSLNHNNKEEDGQNTNHNDDNSMNSPMTVEQVHRQQGRRLRQLVEHELLPAAQCVLQKLETMEPIRSHDCDGLDEGRNNSMDHNRRVVVDIGSAKEVLDYCIAYSDSIQGAIPSKQLALEELATRNGVFLRHTEIPQPMHHALLQRQLGGPHELHRALDHLEHATSSSPTTTPSVERKESFFIYNQNLGLSIWATPRRHPKAQIKQGDDQTIEKKKDLHVVVIGTGMMGSSIALALSSSSSSSSISGGQRTVRVTVLDRLPLQVDGETTMGSWAWINSNEKGASPSSYHTLNCLGMLAWHRCSVVQPLAEWTGSLVRRRTPISYGGHYRAKGPLLHDPMNNDDDDDDDDDISFFSSQDSDTHDSSNVYYYPDEGCVDPGAAVRAMRSKAMEQGVTFIGNAQVTNLIRQPENGTITGVTYTTSSGGKEDDTTITNHTIDSIDVVVVAGGVGSGDPVLGGLPMLRSPGVIAYATPDDDDDSSHPRLKRILVDTIRESHVLQRADGTVLVGGGFLEVGGAASAQARHDLSNTPSSTATITTTTTTNTTDGIMGEALLRAATPLASSLLNRVSLTATVSRNRPMPADGFPAIGRLVDDDNLYYAVTHSGVTLSPLLGELVAMELIDNVHCHLLDSFRPSRLFQHEITPDVTDSLGIEDEC